MMKLKYALLALTAICASTAAKAAVNVVCTLPELAAIAREVGGARVSVVSLAKPDQNYHQIEARPSDVRRVASAELFVRAGMDLDMWADALVNAARNGNVAAGGKGYVDASRMIRKLEVPTGQINGASGDIHVAGNPHYWFDPGDAKVIAYEIDLGLRSVDPKGAATYDANYKRFSEEITRRMAGWEAELAPYKGRSVVAYHDEWVYFLKRFNLRALAYLEPKPGIPPSASHVNNLISQMKQAHAKAVVVPSIYAMRYPALLEREAGANVARVPYSVGSLGTTSYFNYMDAIVAGFRKALS
ncbi:MAG TPA: metal ABC transporter substrate-binding protein [Armatimonadota bacterium]|jgi:ABC-type Zn uptake system ZnuABC Zn-binding protein ZnuA